MGKSYDLGALVKEDVASNEQSLLFDSGNVSFTSEPATDDFYVGIDCGSTQTRAVVVPHSVVETEPDLAVWFERSVVFPSVSKLIEEDRQVKYRSPLLADRLDSCFSVNGGEAHRIVRGSKALDYEVKQNELYASEKKIDSGALRFNIIDAIGFCFVQFSAQSGNPIPSEVSVRLNVALPPDDLKTAAALDKIKNELRVIRWAWCDKEPMTIRIKDFDVCSEPEAQVKAYYSLHDVDLPEEVVMVEVGGRNGATALLLRGETLEQGDRAIEVSGTQLLDKIGDEYMSLFGGKMPSMRYLQSAIQTGQMKHGNEYRDITDIIKKSKDLIAEDIFYKLQSNVISRQTVIAMQTLDVIVLGGRVFDPGDYNYSVAVKFKELMKTVSPATQVVVLGENLIPQGLVLKYISDRLQD